MRRDDPFAPVPVSRRDRPLLVRRDRRAVDLEHHLAKVGTTSRLELQPRSRRIIIAFIIVVMSTLLARTGYLQLVRGAEYFSAAERNRTRLEVIRAPRGIILDRHGQPLLENIADFTLIATPDDLPTDPAERQAIVDRLRTVAPSVPEETLRQFIIDAPLAGTLPNILATHLDYQTAVQLTTTIARLPGISLDVASSRHYLAAASAAHVIGYLGKPTADEIEADPTLSPLNDIGRMGIERSYDETLRGIDGIREVERDHLNKELAVLGSQPPTPGKNLTLTIDQTLQETLASALTETMRTLRVPGGAAVALDPRNGEVLALVSAPSFDPNLFTRGGSPEEFAAIFNDPNHPLFFRPVSGSYPSGSTVKPVIAAAALNEKVVTPATTVVSTGGITVGPNTFPDWKAGGHGVTDVEKALAESVNTFFYYVGGGYNDFPGLGVDRIVDYLSKFGLAKPLGIDLVHEAAGFLPDAAWRNRPGAARWFLGDTYNLSIGQGYVDVTPLQVAAYTAAIANGGTLYRPRLVQSTINPDGTGQSATVPSVIRTTVDDRVLRTVRSGMRQAVTVGSARGLQSVPVSVAAKTGTAQFGDGTKTHAWITAYAPAEQPEIVITVLVESGGEGSSNALPVARQALQRYFSRP